MRPRYGVDERLKTEDLPQRFTDWVAQQLCCATDQIQLRLVAGDASPRRYYRVTRSVGTFSTEGRQGFKEVCSCIAVVSPASENNRAFLSVGAKFAEFGIRSPEVWAQSLEKGWFLLEDFGDELLLPLLSATAPRSPSATELYQLAFDVLLRITSIPCDSADIPNYDAQRLSSEFTIFPEWFLSGLLKLDIDEATQLTLKNLSGYLSAIFLEQPTVWVHRDFHSRNLMLLDNDELGVIDYQDAVLGPITYDPASILKDCYARLPRDDQMQFLDGYLSQLKRIGGPNDGSDMNQSKCLASQLSEVSAEQFQKWFDLTGLQRHLRVLGVFARLHLRDGKSGYLADLPLVTEYVREALRLTEAVNASVAEFRLWFESDVMPVISEQSWYRPIASEGWA